MKQRCFSALLSALLLISASRVVACGSCVSIHMDRLLPPITGWVVLSLGWSFLLSIYSAITATDIWGVPRPLGWLVRVAIYSLAGLLFVGPLFLLWLMLPGIVVAIRVVFPDQSFTTGQKRDLRVISAVGVACLVGLIIAVLFHALNIVLGAFSPTIQSLRLHYVEFFSKFYQGGGEPFRPFQRSISITDWQKGV